MDVAKAVRIREIGNRAVAVPALIFASKLDTGLGIGRDRIVFDAIERGVGFRFRQLRRRRATARIARIVSVARVVRARRCTWVARIAGAERRGNLILACPGQGLAMAAGFWPTACAASRARLPASGDDHAVAPASRVTIAGIAADEINRFLIECKMTRLLGCGGPPAGL